MYLPLIAFGAAAGLILARVRPAFLTTGAVLLIALTIDRVQVWQTEKTLWSDAAAKAPWKLRPLLQLSRAVDHPESLRLLERAKAIAPENPQVASETGRRYMAMGRPGDALAEFGRALALAPNSATALNNRGTALVALGQRKAAQDDFQAALRVDPCLFDAHYNLAQAGLHTAAPGHCRFTEGEERALNHDR
jgi:tetratricopeptide (TPR) repeat protein